MTRLDIDSSTLEALATPKFGVHQEHLDLGHRTRRPTTSGLGIDHHQLHGGIVTNFSKKLNELFYVSGLIPHCSYGPHCPLTTEFLKRHDCHNNQSKLKSPIKVSKLSSKLNLQYEIFAKIISDAIAHCTKRANCYYTVQKVLH